MIRLWLIRFCVFFAKSWNELWKLKIFINFAFHCLSLWNLQDSTPSEEMAYKQFIALGFSLCSISVINSQFFSVPYWTSYSTSNNPSYQTSINNRETFTQPQSFSSSSSSCNEYFSYQNDFNGQYGLVSIPVPSGSSQIHLKVKLSLAARLSSVRSFTSDFPCFSLTKLSIYQWSSLFWEIPWK